MMNCSENFKKIVHWENVKVNMKIWNKFYQLLVLIMMICNLLKDKFIIIYLHLVNFRLIKNLKNFQRPNLKEKRKRKISHLIVKVLK